MFLYRPFIANYVSYNDNEGVCIFRKRMKSVTSPEQASFHSFALFTSICSVIGIFYLRANFAFEFKGDAREVS
jgi:hypothetical protein